MSYKIRVIKLLSAHKRRQLVTSFLVFFFFYSAAALTQGRAKLIEEVSYRMSTRLSNNVAHGSHLLNKVYWIYFTEPE
jgi:hypothetical protein